MKAIANFGLRVADYRPEQFDFEQLPAGHGVFLLETNGAPYLSKSVNLRRRVARLLGTEGGLSKRLNLGATAHAIRYKLTGSAFESSVLLYRLARQLFPHDYRVRLRLRPFWLLKLNLENEFPRCYLTRRLRPGPSLYFGPFPRRSAAERFASDFLDLFKSRRCAEDLHPHPAHPGCIYGEMGMCLRPCQAAVSRQAYLEEVARVGEFLSTQGGSLVRVLEAERDRASAELNFEEAARLHKRLEKVEAVLQAPELAQRGGLATDLERLHGVVIQRSAEAQAVVLFPVYRAFLLPQVTFSLAPDPETGKPVSLDARLREVLLTNSQPPSPNPRLRAEHLALLARWFYRGTRQGEFVGFDNFEQPPFRRLVNAIARVARGLEQGSESSPVL